MSVDTAMPAAELQSAGLDQRADAEWVAAAGKPLEIHDLLTE